MHIIYNRYLATPMDLLKMIVDIMKMHYLELHVTFFLFGMNFCFGMNLTEKFIDNFFVASFRRNIGVF